MYYSNGNYEAFARPRKPDGVEDKTAWFVGAGLASMAGAAFLIRDGQMSGDRITILERLKLPGGALDGVEKPSKGFVIRGGIVTVHRAECPATARMTASGRTSVPVGWLDGSPAGGYRATVLAEALSRPRLFADLTEVIAAEGIGIVSAAVEPPQEHRVRHTYTVELSDPQALTGLMRAMRAVPGVYDVYRARSAFVADRD